MQLKPPEAIVQQHTYQAKSSDSNKSTTFLSETPARTAAAATAARHLGWLLKPSQHGSRHAWHKLSLQVHQQSVGTGPKLPC
jgi:hypothetical protein